MVWFLNSLDFVFRRGLFNPIYHTKLTLTRLRKSSPEAGHCRALKVGGHTVSSQHAHGSSVIAWGLTVLVRGVGGQKSGKFVKVYSMKIVNKGRLVVKNLWKIGKVNCERPLTLIIHTEERRRKIKPNLNCTKRKDNFCLYKLF